MVSTQKETVEITTQLVQNLITQQFPQWAHLPVRPVENGGWDNRTFHLGEYMSVRLPSAERYAGKITKELEWLPQLAPQLSLPIPTPLALGKPTSEYRYNWAVYVWIPGERVSRKSVRDFVGLATALGTFLRELHTLDATRGPIPGPHNFYRGGPLATYDHEVREALSRLHDKIDTNTVRILWEKALASTWTLPAVWVHGDIAPGNLLVVKGKLSAVIDFGGLGVGDPACDLAIAWTLFTGKSREAFKAAVNLDEATWARARGWALWKALIVCAELPGTDIRHKDESARVLTEILTLAKEA